MILTPEGFYVLENDSHLSRWVEERRTLEDHNFAPFVESLVKSGDCVIDGGANIGITAATFARLVGPTGRVIAFEPGQDACACLEKNCPEVDAQLKGLSDDHGHAQFVQQPNAGASFLKIGEGPIDIIPIDHLKLERLNVLKLDLEGMEVRALLGARATIRRCRPIIIAEVNAPALARYWNYPIDIFLLLDSLGYRYANLYPGQAMVGDQYDIVATPL